ncbi:hypothetical protein HPB49_022623 [Dermacentor silvarum]|uniref:Uncharacterized protein n=1 Tax=Dermacentor silvarum TaxID=543639 RepID=A0ACB8DRK2_DERSI|nr:hypothetical protein HPB49_022623 [Dermacentor silvarum]
MLLSAEYFKKLPEELRRVEANALLNHLGFRAVVRLAVFMPESLRVLRELSYLEHYHYYMRAPLCGRGSGCPIWRSPSFMGCLVSWLDERALFALAFRLRRIRVDPPFSFDMIREDVACVPADLAVGNSLADILGLFRKMRTRRTILELRSGPGWHPLSPLSMWPDFDAALRRVRIPQGSLNDSVPANSSIFAFHLSRVAVRFYASMVPLLYSSYEYDREAALDLGRESERLFEGVRRCLEDDWRALSDQDAAGLPLHYGLLDHRAWWLRQWLLEQTLVIELALHAFRELLDLRRTWKLQYRFVTLPDYTSTQLFFMY